MGRTMDRKLDVGTVTLITTYVQNLGVFVFQTDRQIDRQRNTPAAHGLEELFSAV
jgi:hypothetical protein